MKIRELPESLGKLTFYFPNDYCELCKESKVLSRMKYRPYVLDAKVRSGYFVVEVYASECQDMTPEEVEAELMACLR